MPSATDRSVRGYATELELAVNVSAGPDPRWLTVRLRPIGREKLRRLARRAQRSDGTLARSRLCASVAVRGCVELQDAARQSGVADPATWLAQRSALCPLPGVIQRLAEEVFRLSGCNVPEPPPSLPRET